MPWQRPGYLKWRCIAVAAAAGGRCDAVPAVSHMGREPCAQQVHAAGADNLALHAEAFRAQGRCCRQPVQGAAHALREV